MSTQNRQSFALTTLLILVVLLVGIVASISLTTSSQDLRRAASTDGIELTPPAAETTPAPSPSITPLPTATTTPNPTPTVTPQPPLVCGWCNGVCGSTSPDQCTETIPRTGYVCAQGSDSQACEAIEITCVRKPSCLFNNPPCAPDLPPHTVFCADSDLNEDKRVDAQDLQLLGMHFFETSPAALAVDINHDGVVNLYDYSLMVKEWTR